MRNEQEVLRHKVIRKGLSAETPVWFRGKRSGSWAFVCGVCGEVCYYPQNTREKEENRRVVMGYRYCPYCRTKMEGIAVERVNAGKPLPKPRAEMAGVAIMRVDPDAETVRPRTVSPGSVDAAAILDGMNVERFAERLRDTLKQKHLMQLDVAKKAGINEARMSKYIWGVMRPDFVHLYNLAVALGVDITWLSGQEDTGPD